MTDVVHASETTPSAGPESEAGAGAAAVDDQLVGMLVKRARAEGLQLTGAGGLLQLLTKRGGWRPLWRASSLITSAMRSMMRPGRTVATPATGRGPRPC